MRFLNENDLIEQGSFFYEFSYDCDPCVDISTSYFQKDSLYLGCEDFWKLSPYLDSFFVNYPYYGPKKIQLEEWNKFKKICLLDNKSHTLLSSFFERIDDWLSNNKKNSDYFWILGV